MSDEAAMAVKLRRIKSTLAGDAADALDRLAAENKRLREALEAIANWPEFGGGILSNRARAALEPHHD